MLTNGHQPHRALPVATLAYQRGHPHRRGILAWTLALGWRGAGWVAALLYTLWTWGARIITEF